MTETKIMINPELLALANDLVDRGDTRLRDLIHQSRSQVQENEIRYVPLIKQSEGKAGCVATMSDGHPVFVAQDIWFASIPEQDLVKWKRKYESLERIRDSGGFAS